jgi:hypothetical protein
MPEITSTYTSGSKMDAKTAILSFVDIAKIDVAKAVSLLREGLSNQQPGTGTGSGLSALSGHFDLHVIPLLAQLLDKYLSKVNGDKNVGENSLSSSNEGANVVISDDVAFDCFWALVNIGAGDSSVTQLLLKHGVAELAVRAVRECRSQEVVENAIWVLGNIAGDGQASRETLYNMGASEVLSVRTACELGRLGYFPFGTRFQRATEVAAALAAASISGEQGGGGGSSSSSSESVTEVSGINNAVFPSRGPRRKSSFSGDASLESTATAATAVVSHGPSVAGGLASRKNGNHSSGGGGGGRLKYTTPLLKIAMWTLSNLCENDSEGRRSIPNLRNVLAVLSVCLDCPDAEVQSHACWALSHIADGPTEHMFDILCSLCASVPPVPISVDANLPASMSDTFFDENVLGSWVCLPSAPGKDAATTEAAAALPLATSTSLQDRYSASEVFSKNRELVNRASSLWNESNAGPTNSSLILLPSAACRVVRLLRHDSTRVTKPALRCVGNIVCAEDNDHDFTQVLVDLGVVSQLNRLMVSSARDILKEACWTMSNVAAGSSVQIQAVLDSGCIPRATHLCTDPSTDPSVRNEACWIILNSISCGTEQQIDSLVRKGAVRVLCQLLPEPTMSVMALEGLEKILNVIETLSKRKNDDHPRLQNQSSDARKGASSGGSKTEGKSSLSTLAASAASLNANSTLVGTLATAITNAFANLGNLSVEDQVAMGYVGQEHRGGSKSRGGVSSSALTTANLFEAKCLLETFRVELSSRGAANTQSNDSSQKDDLSALGQASQAAFGQATQKIKSALTSQNLSSALLNAKQGSPSGDYAMRRVTKLWGDHFVSCQLCHRSWPKNAASTRFCDECRCNVCSECNCEKFHLSYQLQLLEEPSTTTPSSASKAGNNNGGGSSGGSAASSKNSEKAQGVKKRATQNPPQTTTATNLKPAATTTPAESQPLRSADSESSSSSTPVQDTDDWDESLLISSQKSAPKTVRRAVQAQNRSSSSSTSSSAGGIVASQDSTTSTSHSISLSAAQQQNLLLSSDMSEFGGSSNDSGWEPIKTKAQSGRARRRGDTELVPSSSSVSQPSLQSPLQSPQKQFATAFSQSPQGKTSSTMSTTATSSISLSTAQSSGLPQNVPGKTTTTPPQQSSMQFKTLQQQLSKPIAPLSVDNLPSVNQHPITSGSGLKVKPPLVPVITSPNQRASTSPTLSSFIPSGSPTTMQSSSASSGERSWKAIVKHGSGNISAEALIRGDTASFPLLPSKLSVDETGLDSFSNPQLPSSLYAENETSSSSPSNYFEQMQHQHARSQSFGQSDDLSQQQGVPLSSIAWRGKIPASVKPAEVSQYPGVSSSSLSSLSQQQQMLQTLSTSHFSGNNMMQHPSLQPFSTGTGTVVENEALQMQLMIQQMLATAASASFSAQEVGGLASTQESIFSAIFANPPTLPSQFIDADSTGGSKFSSAQSSRGGSIDEPPMRAHSVNNNGWPVLPTATRHDVGRGHSDSFLQPIHVDSFLHASNGVPDGIRSASESSDLVSGVGSSVWGDIRSGDAGVTSSLPSGNGANIDISGGGTGLSIPLLPRLWGSTSPTSFDDRAPIFASSTVLQQHQQQQQQIQPVQMSFSSASDEENVLKSLALDL